MSRNILNVSVLLLVAATISAAIICVFLALGRAQMRVIERQAAVSSSPSQRLRGDAMRTITGVRVVEFLKNARIPT